MGNSCSSASQTKNTKPGVVDLFVFPRTSKDIHMSPPCCKIEAFLRYNRIPYILHTTTDFAVSPNDRLPFAIVDDKPIAESELIIEALIHSKKKQYISEEFVVNRDLTEKQSRLGRTICRLMEYPMRFGIARWQLVDHLDWVVDSSRDYAPSVPRWILKSVLSSKNRNTQIETLNGCGHGDKTQEHYHQELLDDVKAIEGFLQDVGGEDGFIVTSGKPSRYDAEVYAMMHLIRIAESIKDDCPGAKYALSSTTIQNYLKKMDALCFPDMAKQLEQHQLEKQDFSELQWLPKENSEEEPAVAADTNKIV